MDNNDWRTANGRCGYLRNAKLTYVPEYHKFTDSWEHEHCSFCYAVISEEENELHSAYHDDSPPSRMDWICEECFADFKDTFNFTVDSHEILSHLTFEKSNVHDNNVPVSYCEICTAKISDEPGCLSVFFHSDDENGETHILCEKCHGILFQKPPIV